jgi:hypothetical protein
VVSLPEVWFREPETAYRWRLLTPVRRKSVQWKMEREWQAAALPCRR